MKWRYILAPWVFLREIEHRLDSLETAPEHDPNPDFAQELRNDLASLRTELDALRNFRASALEDADKFEAGMATLARAVDELQTSHGEVLVAVSEAIQQTQRHEARIRAVVKRARNELKERGYTDPGVEGEARELRLVDDGGSPEGGVPAVPGQMDLPIEEPSSVRGVSLATLKRVRGLA
jgi:hypothetical protein